MRWPGQIKAGSVSDHQFAFYDLMPTFCDLAGISGYPDAFKNPNLANDYFDGISIYPTLMGQTDKQQKHDYLYWEFHETNMLGLRMGDWKWWYRADNANCLIWPTTFTKITTCRQNIRL